MVAKSRTLRIAERIREELSEILISQIQDPRLSGVSITDVTVDRELTVANVYFSSLEGSARAKDIQQSFEHAQGYLRTELAGRVDLRTFPRLHFHFDPTFERAEKIERLIATLNEETAAEEENEA